MMDSHVPPHHVCSPGSQSSGRGVVRAGAVADGGAKRSVNNLAISTLIHLSAANAASVLLDSCLGHQTYWYICRVDHSFAFAATATRADANKANVAIVLSMLVLRCQEGRCLAGTRNEGVLKYGLARLLTVEIPSRRSVQPRAIVGLRPLITNQVRSEMSESEAGRAKVDVQCIHKRQGSGKERVDCRNRQMTRGRGYAQCRGVGEDACSKHLQHKLRRVADGLNRCAVRYRCKVLFERDPLTFVMPWAARMYIAGSIARARD